MAVMTLVYEQELPIPFTVADGTGIAKGALLKMTTPMTASQTDGTGDVIAGVAAEEKIASDGKTTLACYRRGIFKVTASGAIAIGEPIVSCGETTHTVEAGGLAAGDIGSGASIIGHALETAEDTNTILAQIHIGAGLGDVA